MAQIVQCLFSKHEALVSPFLHVRAQYESAMYEEWTQTRHYGCLSFGLCSL
jgi:hypothetical protein